MYFNFFKKRKKIDLPRKEDLSEEDFLFLEKILSNLPDKYEFLENQVSKDFLIKKSQSKFRKKGTFSFSIDGFLFESFLRPEYSKYAEIQNIKIWNKTKADFEEVTLRLLRGTLFGYYLHPEVSFSDLDLNKFDVSKLQFIEFEDNDKEIVIKVLCSNGRGVQDWEPYIDLIGSYKINVEDQDYFVIAQSGNGDNISINEAGFVFGMIHDPFEVELLFENVDQFYIALNSGQFTAKGYFEKKYS